MKGLGGAKCQAIRCGGRTAPETRDQLIGLQWKQPQDSEWLAGEMEKAAAAVFVRTTATGTTADNRRLANKGVEGGGGAGDRRASTSLPRLLPEDGKRSVVR